MRALINSTLEWLNVDGILTRRKFYNLLDGDAQRWRRLRPFVFSHAPVPDSKALFTAMSNVDELRSQFGQDAFVLSQLRFKTGGYFVDFGATDGVTGSNSHVLEKRYGWTGILAEPARGWHERLQRNRRAAIELACVAGTSGASIPFYEKGVFSGMEKHIARATRLKRFTRPGRFYEVPTISLLDLLRKHQAPKVIDYLSMDTEGSELEILSGFDFSAFRFRTITVEHNHKPDREKILALLSSHGYRRGLESISETDDFYVSGEVAQA